MYNDTLTGNSKNNSISGNLVSYGLKELKNELPNNLYNIVKKYTTQELISGGFFQTSSDSVKPHHINTIIIIQGVKGTYLLNGGLYSPSEISNYNDTYLLHNSENISYIGNVCATINNYINEAM